MALMHYPSWPPAKKASDLSASGVTGGMWPSTQKPAFCTVPCRTLEAACLLLCCLIS